MFETRSLIDQIGLISCVAEVDFEFLALQRSRITVLCYHTTTVSGHFQIYRILTPFASEHILQIQYFCDFGFYSTVYYISSQESWWNWWNHCIRQISHVFSEERQLGNRKSGGHGRQEGRHKAQLTHVQECHKPNLITSTIYNKEIC